MGERPWRTWRVRTLRRRSQPRSWTWPSRWCSILLTTVIRLPTQPPMLATCSCPMWTACSGTCMHACTHAHGHAYLRVPVVVQDGDGVSHAGLRPSWSTTTRLGCLPPRWTWLMRRADSGILCMPRSLLMSVRRSACGLCGGCLCCGLRISWILACRSLAPPRSPSPIPLP